ncbi:uncharacterized protein LOC111284469 [Durio zibethinus]|uniref:Uncharacterized protein LOC111284469 n=1 Tax=Durio zibethinus TaxID=66656 RepID=A0A6P5XLT1_DURZI|nr:uncharacterized protein LOC111284469 [Durio zibethinus]
MAKLISSLFMVLVLSYLSNRVDGKVPSKETLENVDRKLKLLNKPAVKSIQSEDGDIIDCVDIHKQPAFDHPALRNHVIQMRPSFDLQEDNLSIKKESSKQVVTQTWQRSGSCPEGTVPIRRMRRQDLLRATSLEQFGRKPPQVFFPSNRTNQGDGSFSYINKTKATLGPNLNRSIRKFYCQLPNAFRVQSLLTTTGTSAFLLTLGYNYIGAKGEINVWNPNVASPDDYSTAQIWMKGGPGDDFESLESGWVVNPKLYGDKRTRFFAYWTTDAYKKTGCFDLTCSGFVQTSRDFALGGAIDSWSSKSGRQYYITVGIYMDPKTSNWWLKYADDITVGYWPAGSLMFYLNHSSTLVQWGGEVYSPNVFKTPHTKTAMGSGEFARGLFGNACYINNVRIVDYSLSLKYPEWVDTWSDEDYCYSAYNYIERYGVYPVIYFGGPGQNHLCP